MLYEVITIKKLKHTWDPDNILNPGKIIDTPPITENLRYLIGKTQAINTTVITSYSIHYTKLYDGPLWRGMRLLPRAGGLAGMAFRSRYSNGLSTGWRA